MDQTLQLPSLLVIFLVMAALADIWLASLLLFVLNYKILFQKCCL
jgi:hypothetical protein